MTGAIEHPSMAPKVNEYSVRRAQRLDEIVRVCQDGLTTAEKIAAATKVSTRSIYRDIATLRAAGVRIVGEAGIGYFMKEKRDG